MDGLSALSVAASVAQFIEFGASLVSKSKEIYKSANGLPIQQVEAITAARRLAELSESIKASRQVGRPGNTGSSADERALEAICDGCISVSEELISKLEKLKVEDARKYRKFKSLRQALKSIWSKEAVDEIARRLKAFQTELDQHLLVSLSEKFNNLRILHDETFCSLDQQLRQSIESFLPFLIEIHNKMNNAVALQQKVLDLHEREDFINNHREELSEAARDREEAYLNADATLLQELWFPEISHRHIEIEEAHKKTFAWILKDNPDGLLCAVPGGAGRVWHNFTNWLRESGDLYWINGKAGSGKSTLMRYICDNDITSRYLKSWAGTSKFQMIAFYFWNSGSKEQRSQTGLLRSLLHQILRVRRDIIRVVFEEEWDYLVSPSRSYNLRERSWSFPQLERAFHEALRLVGEESMTCIFVDGLDEFEGDPERLVNLLKKNSELPNVKVCLSSRPWIVFEEHFDGCPGLRLQDLTYDDIRLYVRDRLQENSKMMRLAESHPLHAAGLIHNIVTKANGVFLWVKLVAWSLLDGLRNQDDISELQTRLDLLPSDLDSLYRHMLQRINPLYFAQACRIFQIFNAFSEVHLQPTVLELDLSVTATITDAMNPSPAVMPDQEISQRCHRMSMHLKTRCEGLLEVHDIRDRHWEGVEHQWHDYMKGGPTETTVASRLQSQRVKADLKVAYLHRTVKDFLAADSVREILLNHTGPIAQFEPNMSILMGYIINLKRRIYSYYCRAPRFHDQLVWTAFAEALLIAQKVHSGCAWIPILDEFSSQAFRWANCPYPGWEPSTTWNPEDWHATVLSAGVAFGLTSFVERALIKNSNMYQGTDGVVLMAYALGHPISLKMFDFSISSQNPLQNPAQQVFPSMVNLLFRYGANPNAMDQNYIRPLSMWQVALYSYFFALCTPESREGEQEHAWAEIIQDMLEHGADRDIRHSPYYHTGLTMKWCREYENLESSLLQSNDGRLLLPLVDELRVERGMRPFCDSQRNKALSTIDATSEPGLVVSQVGRHKRPRPRSPPGPFGNEHRDSTGGTGALPRPKRLRAIDVRLKKVGVP